MLSFLVTEMVQVIGYLSYGRQAPVYHTVNAIAAVELVRQRARASAAMSIVTKLSWNIQASGALTDPCGGKTGVIQDNYVNIIATNDLVTNVTRSSVAMVLTTQDKPILVFHGEGFQLLQL